jgi:hypothetical protein
MDLPEIQSSASPSQDGLAVTRQAKWQAKNPLARWAHLATASAIRRGLITPGPCEVCGAERVDAHHERYNEPMRVRWLCRKHHKAEHARLAAEEGGDADG